MNIFTVLGFAVTAAVLAVLLRQYRPEFSMLASAAACVMILAYAVIKGLPVINEMTSFAAKANIRSDWASVLVKSVGICFVAQLGADVCRDAGESAIASKIETAGKLAILLTALPLFDKIASLAAELIGK
jgi:stage III sporulation protein AD